jgi:hypothetical protein
MNLAYLLLLLIAIVITAIVLQKITSSQSDGFANPILPILKTCPHRMNSFIDGKTNNTYCCDSAVNGNICQGRKICAMSPGVTDSPSCAQYLQDYTNEMSTKKCFSTMPTYYEDDSQVPSISGCAAQVNDDYSAPKPNTASCKIYTSEKDNLQKLDSCENKQMVETLKNSDFCKAVNCNDAFIGGNNEDVAWINASYMTQNGPYPVQAYCESKESVIRHIKYGYGDYFANQSGMGPLTGDKLDAALKTVADGTYPGLCGST